MMVVCSHSSPKRHACNGEVLRAVGFHHEYEKQEEGVAVKPSGAEGRLYQTRKVLCRSAESKRLERVLNVAVGELRDNEGLWVAEVKIR
jgi:hypothetical protein